MRSPEGPPAWVEDNVGEGVGGDVLAPLVVFAVGLALVLWIVLRNKRQRGAPVLNPDSPEILAARNALHVHRQQRGYPTRFLSFVEPSLPPTPKVVVASFFISIMSPSRVSEH